MQKQIYDKNTRTLCTENKRSMKKTLLLLFILTGLCSYAQVVAVRDTFTVLQASLDTFDLVQNDTFPAGDSVCISLLDSNTRFTLLDCRRVVYSADSFHTGLDSVRYLVCDTAMACDTAITIVNISTDYDLIPLAHYTEYYPEEIDHLFHNSNCSWFGYQYTLINHSGRADSILWSIQSLYCPDSVRKFRQDTLRFRPANLYGVADYCGSGRLIVHLTATNRYGSFTRTDTSSCLYVEGISEIGLAEIHMSPNPATTILQIDMSQNTDAITSQYSGIDLINMLGQRVKNIPRNGNSKTVQLNVADLPEGIYNATITDAMGETRMLGRFTIER